MRDRPCQTDRPSPAATSTVGTESLGPSPTRLTGEGTPGEGTGPIAHHPAHDVTLQAGSPDTAFPAFSLRPDVQGRPVRHRPCQTDRPSPAATSTVGTESLGPSPTRLAGEGMDGETPSLPNLLPKCSPQPRFSALFHVEHSIQITTSP